MITVVARFVFPLLLEESSRRLGLLATTELSLVEESIRKDRRGARASLEDAIAFLNQSPVAGMEFIFCTVLHKARISSTRSAQGRERFFVAKSKENRKEALTRKMSIRVAWASDAR